MGNESGLQILEIEITTRCNLDCKHCYVDKSNPSAMKDDLLKKVIDEGSILAPHDLIFTGGEPLLCKDLLLKFASYAKKKNFERVGLLTNGLLINGEVAKELKIFDFVQLSLDDVTHNREGYRIDYLNRLKQVTSLLKEEGIHVVFMCTVNKQNIKNLEAIVDFAKKLGVQIGFNRTCPVGSACGLNKNVILAEEGLRDALISISKFVDGENVRCSDPLTILVNEAKKKNALGSEKSIVGGCTAGIAGCYVAVNCDVYPCPLLRIAAGNVSEKSLVEVWKTNDVFTKFRDRDNLKGKCRKCELRNGCGGCRATAFSIKKDILESDPFCWV